MPSTTEVLDAARRLVEGRLAELEEERKGLERALAELGGKAPGRGRGRPRGRNATVKASTGAGIRKAGGRKAVAVAAPRKRRKRRGGTRADEAVKLIEGSPGISAGDVAKTMKIKPNYLYRVLGDLEKEGRVKKDGRQYFPAG